MKHKQYELMYITLKFQKKVACEQAFRPVGTFPFLAIFPPTESLFTG